MNEKKFLLIICPYAGGSGYGMRRYFSALEDLVDVFCMDYSGHGIRHRSKLNNTFGEMVKDVEKTVLQYSNRKIILMGHSMGGILVAFSSFVLKSSLKDNFVGLIISSCLSPNQFEKKHQNFSINKEYLVEYLHNERGVSREIIESEDFEKYILPIVVNDYEVLNDFKNYYEKNELKVPNCKSVLICGKRDYGMENDAMKEWRAYLGGDTPIFSVDGGHFYFEENTKDSIVLFRMIISKMIKGEDLYEDTK